MSSKYKIGDHQQPHFITFAVVEWIGVFTRPAYKNVIIERLKYCQVSKGLIMHAYVIMTNHHYLILSAKEGLNLSDILRDFKKHTSKLMLKMIVENNQESRKSWMKWLFESAGKKNSNKEYQFWQQDNHPIELSTNEMMDQRLEYIHQIP